jgi:hypothetical protein
MKKITLLLATLLITSFGWAQDVIVTKEGKKLNAKVTEINENDIRYKNYENLDGPAYTMKKSEIASIMYENGQVDVFNIDLTTPPPPNAVVSNSPVYTQRDFNRAKGLRNAGVGCFAGGLGLAITGIALASAGVVDYDDDLIIAGGVLYGIGIPALITGIIMWPIGQSRMFRIMRASPNGFALFENEKVQLNLALGGKNVGFKLNF